MIIFFTSKLAVQLKFIVVISVCMHANESLWQKGLTMGFFTTITLYPLGSTGYNPACLHFGHVCRSVSAGVVCPFALLDD